MNTYQTLKEIANKLAKLQRTATSEKEWQSLTGIQQAMIEIDAAIENTKQGKQEAIDFLLGK